MSRINIHRGTFLEKEELVRMLSFLEDRDDISAVLSSSLTYGILSPSAKAGTARAKAKEQKRINGKEN